MNIQEQIQEKLLSLESALVSNHPTIRTLLREIHTTLKENPEVVTLLSEDEIHIVVNGLEKQTATELATSVATSKKGKAVKNMTLEDL